MGLYKVMSDVQWFKTIFLRYIRRAKADYQSFSAFLSSIFRLNRRMIGTIKCISAVELRGSVWVDSKPIEGLINRKILKMRPGQHAWLRIDEDEPFVTLENKFGVVNIMKDKWNAEYRKSFKS